MASKIVLGTAQFGQDYGINNMGGKIARKEAFQILETALENGVDTVDTAYAYGQSEQVLAEFISAGNSGLKIITKISSDEQISKSLKNLNSSTIYGCLLHSFDQYKKIPGLFDFLLTLKREGVISNIGFSLYYPGELQELLKSGLPVDIVQFPYSVFDQRFAPYLCGAARSGISLHVRSVFLQGLVFKPLDSLGTSFQPLKEKLSLLRDIAAENSLSVAALCMLFALKNEHIDKVVVGVDGIKHFRQLLDSARLDLDPGVLSSLVSLAVQDEDILIPSNWAKVEQ